jgi:hypothetical protein
VETATLVCKWGHLLTTENSYVYREGKKPGCRRCRAEAARRGYQKKLKNPLKPCTRCRTNLRQQKGSYCRPCENEYQREWWAQGGRESGKAKRAAQRRKELGQRATALKFKYNLSLAEYAEMLDQQQGLCLICRRPSERTLVDWPDEYEPADQIVIELPDGDHPVGIGDYITRTDTEGNFWPCAGRIFERLYEAVVPE